MDKSELEPLMWSEKVGMAKVEPNGGVRYAFTYTRTRHGPMCLVGSNLWDVEADHRSLSTQIELFYFSSSS